MIYTIENVEFFVILFRLPVAAKQSLCPAKPFLISTQNSGNGG
jgi:hypothetical protein